LHIARRITHDVQTGKMCLTEIVRFDDAAAIHLASKTGGKVALLVLAAGKKYRVAGD
jgi:hypothetical protein